MIRRVTDHVQTKGSLIFFRVVRLEGLEPPRPKAPEPKSGASANSATAAASAALAVVDNNCQTGGLHPCQFVLDRNPASAGHRPLPGAGRRRSDIAQAVDDAAGRDQETDQFQRDLGQVKAGNNAVIH